MEEDRYNFLLVFGRNRLLREEKCASEKLSMVNLMKKFHDILTYHRTIYFQISLPDVDNSFIPINRITSLSISNRTNCNARYAIQPLFSFNLALLQVQKVHSHVFGEVSFDIVKHGDRTISRVL